MLNKPISLSLSLSCAPTPLVVLSWTCSGVLMPSLYSKVSNWYWRVFRYHHLTSAKQRKRIFFLILPAALLLIQPRMWLSFFAVKAHCWLNLICCQPGPQAPFLQSYFLVSQLPAWLAAQDYSVSDAVLCICLYWSSWNPVSPFFQSVLILPNRRS